MAYTASDILDRALHLLCDETGEFFDAEQLLPHLNAAQVDLGNLKPDAVAATVTVKLDEGVLQTLPATSHGFLRLTKNKVAP
jgi:hypothetical protein